MAIGGIIGVVIGIAAVEFAGFEYPFPLFFECWKWLPGKSLEQFIKK